MVEMSLGFTSAFKSEDIHMENIPKLVANQLIFLKHRMNISKVCPICKLANESTFHTL